MGHIFGVAMTDVCILLHGIETDPRNRIWSEQVQARYQRITPIQLIPRQYGYVSGIAVWFSAFKRREVVDHEETYFRGVPGQVFGLFDDIEPGTKVHFVGHSLGDYIGHALLKRGIKFGCYASLWGSSVADFNWHAVDGNFDRARVYWSPEDEILTASSVAVDEDPELALGLMGKEGPQIAHPRVEAIKEPFGFKLHTSFMDDTPERDKFWADMFQWMES